MGRRLSGGAWRVACSADATLAVGLRGAGHIQVGSQGCFELCLFVRRGNGPQSSISKWKKSDPAANFEKKSQRFLSLIMPSSTVLCLVCFPHPEKLRQLFVGVDAKDEQGIFKNNMKNTCCTWLIVVKFHPFFEHQTPKDGFDRSNDCRYIFLVRHAQSTWNREVDSWLNWDNPMNFDFFFWGIVIVIFACFWFDTWVETQSFARTSWRLWGTRSFLRSQWRTNGPMDFVFVPSIFFEKIWYTL